MRRFITSYSQCDQNPRWWEGDDGGNGADALDEICGLRVSSNRITCSLTIESHDAIFKVKEGNMLFGYHPFATKDPKVCDRAEELVLNRFVGDGEKLLNYVSWSNALNELEE
ncbi:unnamed protein product [Lactuca saligna]|uniref:Uncharacterized protein n=1 Tax=Lactuca saligna TaxID=75948 RepID=A0AA35Z9F7_LACSI|nr:unnamed protein product [Lactuca saligna]